MAGRSKSKTKKPNRRVNAMLKGLICSWTTVHGDAKMGDVRDRLLAHRNPVHNIIVAELAPALSHVITSLPHKWQVDIGMVYDDDEGCERITEYGVSHYCAFSDLDDPLAEKMADLKLELALLGGELKYFTFSAEILK